MSPTDNLAITYVTGSRSGQSQEGFTAESAECHERHDDLVTRAYLSTHEPSLGEPVRQATADCARALGIEVAGDESRVADFVAAAGGHESPGRDAVLGCVRDAVRAHHPNLDALNVSY